jgi:uncharacterized protein YjlB
VLSEPAAFRFADDGVVPNSALPLLVYAGVLRDRAPAAVQRLFAAHGWGDGWVNGIFARHHYHSTAHEVLGVTDGWAEVRFGGPQGETLRVEAGDVVVVPAGVGHCRLTSGGGFRCVGAYPSGQRPDLRHGEPGDREGAPANVAAVPRPAQDPVYGPEGPLHRHWPPS